MQILYSLVHIKCYLFVLASVHFSVELRCMLFIEGCNKDYVHELTTRKVKSINPNNNYNEVGFLESGGCVGEFSAIFK